MREEWLVSSGWTPLRTALKEVEPDVQGTFSAREELPDSLSSSSSPANAPRLDSFAFADMTGVDLGKTGWAGGDLRAGGEPPERKRAQGRRRRAADAVHGFRAWHYVRTDPSRPRYDKTPSLMHSPRFRPMKTSFPSIRSASAARPKGTCFIS